MPTKLVHPIVLAAAFAQLCFAVSCADSAPVSVRATAISRYVFTDGTETIRLASPVAGPVAYTEKVITTSGWGATKSGVVPVVDGTISVAALAEGINIVTLALDSPVEVRFLAMNPPRALNRAAMLKSLPINGEKLVAGKPWKFDSLGDSVTSTGDYPGMLRMLLARATGNKNITFVNRAKFGMTTDYTVRMFPQIVAAEHPDAALIMYGLNDQRNYAPDAYLAQYQWLGNHLRSDVNSDPVFLQPTPHFAVANGAGLGAPNTNPPEYAFRTIGYGAWLSALGAQMRVPVAHTFDAVWGKGGATIADAVLHAWPILPRDFNDQLSTMLESNGAGDPVHVNALGQLQIAKAVYAALDGLPSVTGLLAFVGNCEWVGGDPVTHLNAKNVGDSVWTGTLTPYPMLGAVVATTENGVITLKPGAVKRFDVTWPRIIEASDLLTFPYDLYLASRIPLIPVVAASGQSSHVYAVDAPFDVEPGFVRGRYLATSNRATVRMTVNYITTDVIVDIPKSPPVGGLPMMAPIGLNGKRTPIAAELAYARFSAAVRGEATVDGDLSEWAGADWIPVGEYPTQASWITGPEDHRGSVAECYAELSLKAGKSGVTIAGKVIGSFDQDSFVLYFDPRSADQLGTPGGYYWLNARFNSDGTLALSPGETSQGVEGLLGKWRATATGATFEIFAPYSVFDATDWPSSGDLGFSCWWQHTGPSGLITNLMWFEDGFPWTPLWYGVVRLDDGSGKPLPYVVRVK